MVDKDTRRRSLHRRSSRARQRPAARGTTCTAGSCRTPGLQRAGSCGDQEQTNTLSVIEEDATFEGGQLSYIFQDKSTAGDLGVRRLMSV